MKPAQIQALALFGLGLLASTLFCWLIYPLLGETASGIDPDGYGAAGQTWYATDRFRASDKAPLYPAFIALVVLISGGPKLWAM